MKQSLMAAAALLAFSQSPIFDGSGTVDKPLPRSKKRTGALKNKRNRKKKKGR